MNNILICSSIASSGGVSNHTKNLIKFLPKYNVKILMYSFFGDYNISNIEVSPFLKTYRRTLGLSLYSMVNKNDYNIIHIQASGGFSSFISTITGCFISKLFNKKFVITFHYSQTEYFVKKYKYIFGFVLYRSDKFIIVSKKQKAAIEKIFPHFSDKLTVIPNGYDPSIFYFKSSKECREILGLPIDKKIIVNLSNLINTKGHKYLIEAIGEVCKIRKDVICTIVGKGNLSNELNTQIIDLKLNDFIKLEGWKQEKELILWLNSCDIFVLPSLAEGNPTVMFEALACGKPFIGTNVGGIPEIINSEEYGLLCEPANSKDLAENIIIALEKKWDQKKILMYAEQFSWENIAKQTVNVYKNVTSIK